jgi:hypothetical protein
VLGLPEIPFVMVCHANRELYQYGVLVRGDMCVR